MTILFTENTWEEYLFWQNNDEKMIIKINILIKEIIRDPNKGIGKPEKLKNNLSGWYSRRINLEHRIVYKFEKNSLIILQCKFHY